MIADVCATQRICAASAEMGVVARALSRQICSMNDLLLNELDDLQIASGDFVIGDATVQHQRHIILAQKGEYKEHPEIGVGIANALQDDNPRQILTQIRRNFEYDGMSVQRLEFNDDSTITVDAPYT